MTGPTVPIVRRFWFADSAALVAIRDAEDPPNWDDGGPPTTVICLDTPAYEAMVRLAPEENLHIVNGCGAPHLGDIFRAELNREQARYLHFAFHAIEDFAPALELLGERLAQAETQALRTTMLPVSAFGVGELTDEEAPSSECYWIETGFLKTALAGADMRTAPDIRNRIAAILESAMCEALPLVTGAYYLTAAEQPALGATEREAARWRARTAKAWSEIDRLRSEKRVRAGREAALKARHERDLERQAARSSREIDRLYRAAGWAGRWRSRFARLIGRR
ncbi:MAG: hypothetical protein ACSHW2_02630 [Parasphingopyxis sp.]